MAEALAQVKRDLGREAVILSTRTIKKSGLMGLASRPWIEISATADAQVVPQRRAVGANMPPAPMSPTPAESPRRGAPQTHAELLQQVAARQAVLQPKAPPPSAAPALDDELRRELQDLKSMVHALVARDRREGTTAMPVALQRAYGHLIQNQVTEELAADLLRKIRDAYVGEGDIDPEFVREQLVRHIAASLKPSSAIDISQGTRKVVAMVGPTGVGKTTTVAKLAAHFKLRENKRVGLVTIDTFRIAAVDQLRTYARIIDIPLEVVLTPEELSEALGRLSDCDVVLVDTAGRSQFDEDKLNDLQAFLAAAAPCETHLVLAGNCSQPVLNKAVEQFARMHVDRIVFTKLDETVGMGALLGVMDKVEARLSYVTTGQNVPDDIEVGDGRRLARMIIEGSFAADTSATAT